MGALSTIDNVVNFIPCLPLRVMDAKLPGPQAAALGSLGLVGYIVGCAAQGAGAAYITLESGGSGLQSAAVGAAVTLTPPVVKALRFLYLR